MSIQWRRKILCVANRGKRLYRDQLALSERHLDNLLHDTTSALDLLATLSESFKSVESQTTAFQGQCEDLLTEQKRLRNLADEVGTELQYYAYLEPLTRRLNAPGAARLIRSDDFLDMLMNLNTCIDFMDQHVSGLLFHVPDTQHARISTWKILIITAKLS
jgi:DNA repair exonuclease SbcCD ATPase subunit